MMNRFQSLIIICSMNYNNDKNMVDHVPMMESDFWRLNAVGTNLQEEIQVHFSNSPSGETEPVPTMASVHTLQENTVIWNYVTILFIEVLQRYKNGSPWTQISQQLATSTKAVSLTPCKARKTEKQYAVIIAAKCELLRDTVAPGMIPKNRLIRQIWTRKSKSFIIREESLKACLISTNCFFEFVQTGKF